MENQAKSLSHKKTEDLLVAIGISCNDTKVKDEIIYLYLLNLNAHYKIFSITTNLSPPLAIIEFSMNWKTFNK